MIAGPLFVLWLLCSGPLFLLPALALWRLWSDYQMWRWRTGRRRGPMPLS